jgi:hypothetical protein
MKNCSFLQPADRELIVRTYARRFFEVKVTARAALRHYRVLSLRACRPRANKTIILPPEQKTACDATGELAVKENYSAWVAMKSDTEAVKWSGFGEAPNPEASQINAFRPE